MTSNAFIRLLHVKQKKCPKFCGHELSRPILRSGTRVGLTLMSEKVIQPGPVTQWSTGLKKKKLEKRKKIRIVLQITSKS